MVRYRRLSSDELESLEPEFVQFLVVNGITSEDWIQIKANDQDRMNTLLDLFSDVILEGIITKINFIQYRDQNAIRCFQCLEAKIIMVALETNDEKIDLRKFKSTDKTPSNSTLSTSSKPYKPDRSTELWRMLEAGGEISDGHDYKTLCLGL